MLPTRLLQQVGLVVLLREVFYRLRDPYELMETTAGNFVAENDWSIKQDISMLCTSA
jgi:hypothetical protein